MHDQAIEARTRLQLERATERQSQELEDQRLDSQMARAAKRRKEQAAEVDHEMELGGRKQEAELRGQEARRLFQREQGRLEAEVRERLRAGQDARRRDHLRALRDLGVDLTAYLTQGRPTGSSKSEDPTGRRTSTWTRLASRMGLTEMASGDRAGECRPSPLNIVDGNSARVVDHRGRDEAESLPEASTPETDNWVDVLVEDLNSIGFPSP